MVTVGRANRKPASPPISPPVTDSQVSGVSRAVASPEIIDPSHSPFYMHSADHPVEIRKDASRVPHLKKLTEEATTVRISGICSNVSDLIKEAVENGGSKDFLKRKNCRRALTKIRLSLLSTKDIEGCIRKLTPLLSDDDGTIMNSVTCLMKELNADLEVDAEFPKNLSADEVPSLFETLRSICCQRHYGTITSDHWVRVTRVLCRLIDISSLPYSDLSVGKRLSFTISFICESSEGKTKAAAKVLADKIERDFCTKKITEAVLNVKSYARYVEKGVHMHWVSHRRVEASLTTLMDMPANRVLVSFIVERAILSLQQLATYSTTEKSARKLLQKIFD